MTKRVEYRVSKKASGYVLSRVERSVDANGKHAGSILRLGTHESAERAEQAKEMLKARDRTPLDPSVTDPDGYSGWVHFPRGSLTVRPEGGMRPFVEYSVRRIGNTWAVVRIERRLDAHGKHKGSVRTVSRHESAEEADRTICLLQLSEQTKADGAGAVLLDN